MGDFNEILFAEEKQGWLIRPERQMQGIRDALDFCRLRDLGFNGFPFTWCNRGRVVRMFGFSWIEEWLQLSGF